MSRSLYARTRLVRNARLRRQTIVGRVLKYLDSTAESEGDAWMTDDIRIARNAVLNASTGVRDPWGFAFWSYFGKTHKKAMLIWAERAHQTQQALERCAVMVRERQTQASLCAMDLAALALPPKKPNHSVRRDPSIRKPCKTTCGVY
jgi:hypothetical protein